MKLNNSAEFGARHFPYKHPLFGTAKRRRTGDNSVYYWWWQFLKRSELYKRCCDGGGTGPFRSLYEDFGDVRNEDFRKWWTTDRRGERLFGEPKKHYSVEVLKEGQAAPTVSEFLTVALPYIFPKKYLSKQVNEMLKEYHPGKRGKLYARNSGATYKVTGQPNLAAMRLTLSVFDCKQANPQLKLWEVGQRTKGLAINQKIRSGDTYAVIVDKKRILSVSVSRYLKSAKDMIKSTECGGFPYCD